MLLRNGWDDQGGMEVDEGSSQRTELRIPSRNFDILGSISKEDKYQEIVAYPSVDFVYDVASIGTLTSIGNDNLQVGILVEDLLNSAVVATLWRREARLCLCLFVVVFLVIANVVWSGEELRRLVRRGLRGGRRRGLI